MQTLTLKVPPEISKWLDKRARELNRSKSEIVRQAITAQFNGEKKFASLLDRAGDLVGMYASGRKDSSHKKHLKNLGRKSLGQWKRS
jgi:flagellin-like hook-associated protein FlgL